MLLAHLRWSKELICPTEHVAALTHLSVSLHTTLSSLSDCVQYVPHAFLLEYHRRLLRLSPDRITAPPKVWTTSSGYLCNCLYCRWKCFKNIWNERTFHHVCVHYLYFLFQKHRHETQSILSMQSKYHYNRCAAESYWRFWGHKEVREVIIVFQCHCRSHKLPSSFKTTCTQPAGTKAPEWWVN